MNAILKPELSTDWRSFLMELANHGELVEINEEVDPHWELGALMNVALDNRGPAQHYKNVKGTMPGTSITGGLWSSIKRMALALNLPPDTDYHGVVDFYGIGMKKRLAPEFVDQGVCQQNIMLGDDIDITKFPAPLYRPQDGGAYFSTINVGVSQDPDSGWVNWGTYRGMLQSRNSTGILLYPFTHGGMMLRKRHERGEAMEFAQFYGGDPLYHIVAGSGIPANIPEVEIVGGIRGKPVELVKCKTIDLYVPANAELVLEGTIAPDDELPEGPYGEFPGYVVTGELPRPVYRLSAVTHRNDPILPGHIYVAPINSLLEWPLEMSARIKQSILDCGLPVDKVAIPDNCGIHAIVISTKTPYAGIPQMLAKIVWTDRNGRGLPHVFVVNDDVDPADMDAVFHAFITKCNPDRDIYIDRGSYNTPLTPYLQKDPLKELGAGGGNVLYDCTWPLDWGADEIPHRLGFDDTYPEDLKKQVLEKARGWGLIRS